LQISVTISSGDLFNILLIIAEFNTQTILLKAEDAIYNGSNHPNIVLTRRLVQIGWESWTNSRTISLSIHSQVYVYQGYLSTGLLILIKNCSLLKLILLSLLENGLIQA